MSLHPLHSLRTTTPILGEDPVWTLIKSYEKTCRNLRELRAQIASLQAQEALLEASRISTNSALASVSRPARDQVFSTLEIMESIFAFAVRPTAQEKTDAFYSRKVRYSDAYPVVHAIARVCSLWRNIAIHAPRLWQRIVFSRWHKARKTDFACASFRLQSWLRRSFPLPLIIDWCDSEAECYQLESWSNSLFNSLSAHSSRWQAVRLEITLPRYNACFPLALPRLKDLSLCCFGGGSVPTLGSMPLLRNLALDAYSTVDERAFPWQQLTTLRIFNDTGIPRQAIQACCALERLYVYMGGIGSPFDIDQATELPSLRHFSVLNLLQQLPLGLLNLSLLESMTVAFEHYDIPSIRALAVFFERASSLQTLEINIYEFNSYIHAPLLSFIRSRSVRVLKLKLSKFLLDRHNLSSLLPLLTPRYMMEQFSALEEIHIDVMSAEEKVHDLLIESIVLATLDLVPPDAQEPSLKSVWLHIPASFIEPLSHAFRSSKLQVSSTPLDFDDLGANYFMDGDLLLD
ncbi:hypothetical protein DL96DRAFT_375661 [Flagelloscypha sp. PMI_526]|nr:hypothetical protein DL96DRAFT_375661 [Flagelloscypha sp. PMI_526]